MSDEAALFEDAGRLARPSGDAQRFGGRWRLVGAGLHNVWRFAALDLPADSGRLLLRGPNGTGKTTALEALWPFLMDLDPAVLGAGKSRQTTLTQLMREGADGRRRVGHVWLTLVGPGDEGEVSYGARLMFSEGASPPVRIVSFTVPGRPMRDVPLEGTSRRAFSAEEFVAGIQAADGRTFADRDEYVTDFGLRVWRKPQKELETLAKRLRQVRNPNNLNDLSPREAARALRAVLPSGSVTK